MQVIFHIWTTRHGAVFLEHEQDFLHVKFQMCGIWQKLFFFFCRSQKSKVTCTVNSLHKYNLCRWPPPVFTAETILSLHKTPCRGPRSKTINLNSGVSFKIKSLHVWIYSSTLFNWKLVKSYAEKCVSSCSTFTQALGSAWRTLYRYSTKKRLHLGKVCCRQLELKRPKLTGTRDQERPQITRLQLFHKYEGDLICKHNTLLQM